MNYNVAYFLEQCLNSCVKALQHLSGEIYVVDNASVDNSVEMVKMKFPQVHLIENKKNVGFSVANNQAIHQSTGRYVLLLNPDTVVEEDTFEKVVKFMDEHPDAGGLGVRMLDGKGKFLPESKRGLPTPAVAFYKIFGLAALFPKSNLFGKYHLGYLSEFETNEVDVLSGAFMLLRKSTLDKIGLLDETFFMYGEDIDLSYRIQLGGFKNYYFPETRIIHYKGESTKKSSVNYVFVFYRAMVIFAEKHFSKNNAKLFSFLINIAIYLRAGIAILNRFIKRITLPIIDLSFLSSGLFLLTRYWEQHDIFFPNEILNFLIPIYTITWFLSLMYTGFYDLPVKLKRLIPGTLLGTACILIAYALLPKSWQFSRLYILIGALWVMTYYTLSRIYFHWVFAKKFKLNSRTNSRFFIVGSESESERVENMLKEINQQIEQINLISASTNKTNKQVGVISELEVMLKHNPVDEIIFCAKDIKASEIILWMNTLSEFDVEFKIAQPESLFLIGSNSIHSAGDLYIYNINEISKKSNIRLKRTIDVLISFFGISTFLLIFWKFEKPFRFLKNMLNVLLNQKTLVGYKNDSSEFVSLPKLKPGILYPIGKSSSQENAQWSKINLVYARDYSIFKDLQIIRNNWRSLDQ